MTDDSSMACVPRRPGSQRRRPLGLHIDAKSLLMRYTKLRRAGDRGWRIRRTLHADAASLERVVADARATESGGDGDLTGRRCRHSVRPGRRLRSRPARRARELEQRSGWRASAPRQKPAVKPSVSARSDALARVLFDQIRSSEPRTLPRIASRDRNALCGSTTACMCPGSGFPSRSSPP